MAEQVCSKCDGTGEICYSSTSYGSCPECSYQVNVEPSPEPEAAPSLDCDGEIPAIPANSFYVKGTTEPQQASAEAQKAHTRHTSWSTLKTQRIVELEAQLAALKQPLTFRCPTCGWLFDFHAQEQVGMIEQHLSKEHHAEDVRVTDRLNEYVKELAALKQELAIETLRADTAEKAIYERWTFYRYGQELTNAKALLEGK